MVIGIIFLLLLILYKVYLDISSNQIEPYSYLLIGLGFFLFKFEYVNIILYSILLILFSISYKFYGSTKSIATSILLFSAPFLHLNGIILAQSAFLGALAGISKFKETGKRNEKKIELRRDLTHLLFGTLIFLIALLFPVGNREIITMLIAGGLFLGNYTILSENRLSRMLNSLERKEAPFGSGAFWLSLGLLATLAFVFSNAFMLVILAAILIGDPLATIIGIKFGKHKIFYNKKKSIEGSLAYLLASFALGYIIIGNIALAIALIATFVESLDLKVDDNLSVPIVLIFLIFFLFYF
jgi:dolichol kinase